MFYKERVASCALIVPKAIRTKSAPPTRDVDVASPGNNAWKFHNVSLILLKKPKANWRNFHQENPINKLICVRFFSKIAVGTNYVLFDI